MKIELSKGTHVSIKYDENNPESRKEALKAFLGLIFGNDKKGEPRFHFCKDCTHYDPPIFDERNECVSEPECTELDVLVHPDDPSCYCFSEKDPFMGIKLSNVNSNGST